MKKIFIILNLLLICGCGSSTDDMAFREDVTKDILKLAFVSAGCSMMEDSETCLDSALEELDGNKREQKRENNRSSSYVRTSSKVDTCLSDLYCSTGQTCIKKSFEPTGICVKKVDQYGRDDLTLETRKLQCNYLSDCPVGFNCDLDYKVCIKN